MINGEKILRQVYDLDEDQYQPAGIDLKLGKIEKFVTDQKYYGIVNGVKIIPKYEELKMNMVSVDGKMTNVYSLEPFVPYIATVKDKIKISESSLQFYKPRSTILRCGSNVMTAVGDPGYSGHLSFLIMNFLPVDFVITKGERFAQLVDMRVAGGLKLYDGDYNEK